MKGFMYTGVELAPTVTSGTADKQWESLVIDAV